MLVMPGFAHEEYLEANHAARRAGQDVWAQTAVRPIVFQENLKNQFTLTRWPALAELTGVDEVRRTTAYADHDWRDRLRQDVEDAEQPVAWDLITISVSATHPEVVGRSVAEVAADRRGAPLDVMLDLALEDRLETRFAVPVANFDPAAVGPLLQAEGVLLGLGDGGAHVSQLCDSCFPTTLLGTWCRERGVLTLEQAVHKLTAEPAAFLGLHDRGRLKPGAAADLCVFDPRTVDSGPLARVRDFPGGGERLVADRATGIRHVIVNGTPIRVEYQEADPNARPGQIIRSSPTTEPRREE
jgi:N-acyl-D-aspartate/D-glutamate deacylase